MKALNKATRIIARIAEIAHIVGVWLDNVPRYIKYDNAPHMPA